MASVAKMSHNINVDGPVQGKPNTVLKSAVGSGVIQSKPCAGGQDSTPGTQGSIGITGPLVLSGALHSTEACVEASTPVGSKQGNAYPPVGVKEGLQIMHRLQIW